MSHRMLFVVGAIFLAGLPSARAAAVAECAINVSGVDVEIGRTSLMQCMRYARASMIDKSDVQNRLLRHGEVRYRVGRKDAEISTDGGASWQPMLEELAPVGTSPAFKAADVPSSELQIVGSKPSYSPKRFEERKTSSAEKEPPQTEPTQPAPEAIAITDAAPQTSTRTPEPQRVLALYPCQYEVEGRWQDELSKSLEGCIAVLTKIQPHQAVNTKGYWNGFYINVALGKAYVSEDGENWITAGSRE